MSTSKILAFAGLFLAALFIVLLFPKGGKARVDEVPSVALQQMPEKFQPSQVEAPSFPEQLTSISSDADLPKEVDLMTKLFSPFPPTLPIVETVSYATRVSWLTGRQAYLGDYAAYFNTSKHFIARSLHGDRNYLLERVRLGDRFNVLHREKQIEFHLVLDLSRLKLWLYAYDEEEDCRYLLKSYPVCAGALSPSCASGSLTPLGLFLIGKEKDTAIYKEGVLATWKKEPREMMTVFGVRWIGFAKEIKDCTGSCKGLGFHGVPWRKDDEGRYIEYRECIGKYQSDGCIRLLSEDIEELYAIVTSRTTYAHIVRDFHQATLPGTLKISN